MKKRIACLLGLTLVLGLAGCGTKAQTPAEAPEEAQEETADGEGAAEESEYNDSDYLVENTDITMEELRAANRPTALMKEHESLGFTWENYDADENLQSTVEAQFIFYEGKLWYDAVMTDASGNKTYTSDYEAEDMPGASYNYQEDPKGDARWLTVYPSDEYQYWAAQRWMQDLYPDQTEEITDISTQDGVIILMVRTKYQDSGNYYDTMYYVDPDTKLILYREDSWYDEAGTLLSVDKYTPVYDEPYVSDGVARISVSDAEDSCELTVVFWPGQEKEETQTFRVAKGTYVSVVSNTEYTLYSDPDCTKTMDEIRTQEDQVTVYVKMAETEDQAAIDWEANDKSAQPADWYELQEDGYRVVLKLEDPSDDAYQWIMQNHYEKVIQVEDEKLEDGMYIITLRGAMEELGDAQIALQYTDAWDEQVQDTVVMDLFVNESGEIFVETASRS